MGSARHSPQSENRLVRQLEILNMVHLVVEQRIFICRIARMLCHRSVARSGREAEGCGAPAAGHSNAVGVTTYPGTGRFNLRDWS